MEAVLCDLTLRDVVADKVVQSYGLNKYLELFCCDGTHSGQSRPHEPKGEDKGVCRMTSSVHLTKTGTFFDRQFNSNAWLLQGGHLGTVL